MRELRVQCVSLKGPVPTGWAPILSPYISTTSRATAPLTPANAKSAAKRGVAAASLMRKL